MIVGPAIVRIEPRLAVLIPIHVENLRVAIGVRSVQRASQITARVIRPRLSDGASQRKTAGCILFGIVNPLAPCTKYLCFLVYLPPLYPKLPGLCQVEG